MQQIAGTFLEQLWDNAEAAQTARDEQVTQLQAVGYKCICANLWNVAGYRVYVLTVELAETKRTVGGASSHTQCRQLAAPARSAREVSDDDKASTPPADPSSTTNCDGYAVNDH